MRFVPVCLMNRDSKGHIYNLPSNNYVAMVAPPNGNQIIISTRVYCSNPLWSICTLGTGDILSRSIVDKILPVPHSTGEEQPCIESGESVGK